MHILGGKAVFMNVLLHDSQKLLTKKQISKNQTKIPAWLDNFRHTN